MTSKEMNMLAGGILDDLHAYFDSRENFIDGKHTTEILAKEATRDGHIELANALLAMHADLSDLSKGQFIQSLSNIGTQLQVLESQDIANTKYEKAVDHILKSHKNLFEFIASDPQAAQIDEVANALKETKKNHHKGDMTMVERLGLWQEERNSNKIAGR